MLEVETSGDTDEVVEEENGDGREESRAKRRRESSPKRDGDMFLDLKDKK